jgi:hypothetical protein
MDGSIVEVATGKCDNNAVGFGVGALRSVGAIIEFGGVVIFFVSS